MFIRKRKERKKQREREIHRITEAERERERHTQRETERENEGKKERNICLFKHSATFDVYNRDYLSGLELNLKIIQDFNPDLNPELNPDVNPDQDVNPDVNPNVNPNQDFIPDFNPAQDVNPDWIVRLYFRLDPDSGTWNDLCRIACSHPQLDICDVERIPKFGKRLSQANLN